MDKSVLDSEYEPIYDQLRGILGEHFANYCFIVMDENGNLYYDYTNLPVGKMLIKETSEEINESNKCEDYEIYWEDDEDWDEDY